MKVLERTTPIEKLARRICWLEFAPPRARLGNEREYWASLPQQTRDEGIQSARYWLSIYRELERSKSGCRLLMRAQEEMMKARHSHD